MPAYQPKEERPEMLTHFCKNIMYFMFQHKLSQEDVCSRTGILERTLERVIANKHNRIDPKLLVAICDLFQLTPNDLLLEREEVNYSVIYSVVTNKRSLKKETELRFIKTKDE